MKENSFKPGFTPFGSHGRKGAEAGHASIPRKGMVINVTQKLHDILKQYGKLAIAYSGGVDSSVLLKAACEALSPVNVIAFTLLTQLNPSQEAVGQEELAASLGVKQIYINIDPLTVPEIRANGPRRCYFCKRYMFSQMLEAASRQGFSVLADGTNADDAQGYRPGIGAASELGVVSPLRLAGMTKIEIRALAAEMGLPQSGKPSSPCLATKDSPTAYVWRKRRCVRSTRRRRSSEPSV